jgi:histone H3/H4
VIAVEKDRVIFLFQMDFHASELPLARIKKIMKLDDDVKMISAEVPVLFAKAAEIFIHELTLRAWLHTEESKRRTLQVGHASIAEASRYFRLMISPRRGTMWRRPSPNTNSSTFSSISCHARNPSHTRNMSVDQDRSKESILSVRFRITTWVKFNTSSLFHNRIKQVLSSCQVGSNYCFIALSIHLVC